MVSSACRQLPSAASDACSAVTAAGYCSWENWLAPSRNWASATAVGCLSCVTNVSIHVTVSGYLRCAYRTTARRSFQTRTSRCWPKFSINPRYCFSASSSFCNCNWDSGYHIIHVGQQGILRKLLLECSDMLQCSWILLDIEGHESAIIEGLGSQVRIGMLPGDGQVGSQGCVSFFWKFIKSIGLVHLKIHVVAALCCRGQHLFDKLQGCRRSITPQVNPRNPMACLVSRFSLCLK